MWVICVRGFFSVVEHTERPGVVLIRARQRGDLENACELLPRWWRRPRIVDRSPADYRWGIELSRRRWRRLARRLADEVRYPNFKSAVADTNATRAGVYHDVWWTLTELGPPSWFAEADDDSGGYCDALYGTARTMSRVSEEHPSHKEGLSDMVVLDGFEASVRSDPG